jgi:uncharacterized YccA/Bax inhibitor family protein
MVTEFRTAPPSDSYHQQPDGSWLHYDGAAWVPSPTGPPAAPRAFRAEAAFDKAGLLGLLALVVGTVAYLLNPPIALAYGTMLVGFGIGIWCSFSPRRAPLLAPAFAAIEGFVLGAVSRYYANSGQHVVTLAIVGTVAIVLGVWAVYRTGLVHVGHKFLRVTMVATLGLVAVMVVSILTGWGTSGLSGYLIFGVLYLFIAVMNLFVDYSFAYHAESAGLSADAEWYSAFSIMLASAMVYLALLRIFGGRA